MVTSALRWCLLLPVGLVSAGACGGRAFDGGFVGAGGGVAAAGTSSSAGGAVGSSGAPGAAGSNNGGPAGGPNGAGGRTGSGGAGSTDIGACSQNSDCEVVPVSCCSCGSGPVSDYRAINSKHVDAYNRRCNAADVACGCPSIPYDPNNPVYYYVPTCQAGQCVVVDLQATSLTSCSDDAHCTLRSGTSCCAGCDGGTPIALYAFAETDLENLVCSTEAHACNDCGQYFPGWSAACDTGVGKCRVRQGPCTVQNPCPL